MADNLSINEMFEKVAREMTRLDTGGPAEEQLSIAEASQGLKCAIRAMLKVLTPVQIMRLILHYLVAEMPIRGPGK